MNTVQLGISPLTWTNDDMPELGGNIPFEQCAREMALAGFVGCEVGSRFPQEPRAISEVLAPLGIQVAAAWFSAYFANGDRSDETLDRFEKQMYFLKACGARIINVCECSDAIQQTSTPIFGKGKPVLSAQQWVRVASGLNRLAARACENDMAVAYHPHMGTCIQSEAEIIELMDRTEKDVGLLLDTGHTLFADGNSLALIERFHHRIRHVHLKDIRQNVLERTKRDALSFLDAVVEGVFTIPGDGVIDFAPIIQALKQHRYSGWLMVEAEQDPAKAHPLTFATRAREYIGRLTGI